MKNAKIVLIAVIIFALIGIIFSYPLITNFKSRLPYSVQPAPIDEHLMQGDYLLLYYIYWLFGDYFSSSGQHLFQEPYMFSISGWPRPYEPRGLPSSILFFLFSFFGNPCAYNCMILLSFVLCGLFVFLLSKRYTNNIYASIFSGIIFAVSPFRLTQLFGGHPTGFIIFFVPLIIYFYELLWQERKWIYGWIAAICIFGMSMEEHHMGYYTALFTIVFWLYKLFFCKNNRISLSKTIKLLLPVALGWFLALSYMIYIKVTVISTSIAGSGRTFNEISLYSPAIKSIFQRINTDAEKCIYIGIIVSALIIAGVLFKIFFHYIRQKKQDNFPFIFYFLTFIFTLLLSLGPNLKYIPLYKICYKSIPFFHYPRVPARIFIFALLASSLLAGYGLKIITEFAKTKFMKMLIIFSSFYLLFFDFHIFPKIGLSYLPKGNKTYDHIKSTYPQKPLLELPVWPGESSWASIYFYYTTIYRIPLVNGYSPFVSQKYTDDIFWPLVSLNMGMINKEQHDLLKKLNVKYINLHEEAYPQKVNPFPFKIALENLKKSPYLSLIMHDDPVYLFNVMEEPQDKPLSEYTIPSKTGVFYECEKMQRRKGKITEDREASNDKAVYIEEPVEEPIHLIFGPWQLFPPGEYKITFRMKLDTEISEKNTAALEVTTDSGRTQLVGKDLFYSPNAGYNDYTLHFTLDKLTPLEFRVIYYGDKPVYADYIYLLCEEVNDPEWIYEAEDLFHTGRVIEESVFVTPQKDPKGIMVFGPYRRYPEGKYRVGFRIKAGEKSFSPAAELEIISGHAEKPLVHSMIMNAPLKYSTYYLDLELNKPTVLEFRVKYFQEIPLYVDYIEVLKIED